MRITSAKEMYEVDQYTIHDIGLGPVLMENAGRAVCHKLIPRLNHKDKILVLAGGGHNGGDGFVVARTLHNLDYDVTVLQVVPDEKLVDATKMQKKLYLNCDGRIIVSDQIDDQLIKATVIIDAITGLGIKGILRSPLKEIVEKVNQSDALICSIDLPSGLPADEGITDFIAVRADITVMIGAIKESACIPFTSEYYGEWELVHIGHPPKAFHKITKRFLMNEERFKQTIPRRKTHAHKGTHGKGLLIGGSDLMPGATVLAARAALKTGAGLLTVASTNQVIHHVINHCPEAMLSLLPDYHGHIMNLGELSLVNFNAIALGVGLGRLEQTGALMSTIIKQAHCPLIIDADGIYHLKPLLDTIKERTHPTIITPHPGEMARLLGIDISTLLNKPFYYSRKLAKDYGMYIILKGKETIITSPSGEQAVDLTGNPGLAKGGSGDVLTGITLAMVMQKQSIFDALCNACFLHGTSADLQLSRSNTVYDLLATDVINGIPYAYKTLLG